MLKLEKMFSLILAAAVMMYALNGVAESSPPSADNAPTPSTNAPLFSFADIVDKTIPAVVNISTTQKVSKNRPNNEMDGIMELFKGLLEKDPSIGIPFSDPENAPSSRPNSLGSGFIIDKDGYIVTNYHLIDNADEVSVTLQGDDSKQIKAKIVGKDPKTDIALLKIEVDHPLPFLIFGDSTKTRIGDFVLAIGNPFGLGESVSMGIVSAKARNINSGQYDDFIQTDAAINVGNSGGPMLNTDGEVIGVNSIIITPSKGNIGIGFAIPSSMAQPVIKQLKEKGEIVRGQLGITLQPIDQNIVDGLHLPNNKGALVGGVLKDSPAERAGIKVGDVITKFNGKEIVTFNQLPRMVGEIPINQQVVLEVLRNGERKEIKAIIEKAKDDENKEAYTAKALGMSVQELNKTNQKTFGIEDGVSGVIVTEVERGSFAHLSGLKPGDIILSINTKAISQVKEFEHEMKSFKKNSKGGVLFLISRGGSTAFISVNIN